MDKSEILDYLVLNTYKVVHSETSRHPVGKLFVCVPNTEIIELVPVDLSEDRVVMKLRVDSHVEEDTIKVNGLTLKLVVTI